MNHIFYYRHMPNQPAQDTVTISFTLPRSLNDVIESEARLTLSNKSDIIRRALLNHISPDDRSMILRESANQSSYRKTKRHQKLKSP